MCAVQDMAELESAVADNLLPVDAIGAPHRVLRAFRPLIFLSTPELASSLLVSALPPSMVLHHMYSRAPAALQSPHARSGFTPAQVHSLSPCLCMSGILLSCSRYRGEGTSALHGVMRDLRFSTPGLVKNTQAALACATSNHGLCTITVSSELQSCHRL